jgi:tryptophanyl-tRNA synthetase
MNLAHKISDYFLSVREKRKEFEIDKKKILDILIAGETKARKIAENTMEEVREAMLFG